jgi:molecular chaperone DnaK
MAGLGGAPANIDVTFAIDDDGIVEVSARDTASGQQQSIRVTASSGLTDDEISQMTAASSQYLEEKKKAEAQDAAAQEAQKATAARDKAAAEHVKKGAPGGALADLPPAARKKAGERVDSAQARMVKADAETLASLVAELERDEKVVKGGKA